MKIGYSFIRSDFLIDYSRGHGWYIAVIGKGLYMHKDGSIHPYCGKGNFHDSKEEAESILNDACLRNTKAKATLPEELFDI